MPGSAGTLPGEVTLIERVEEWRGEWHVPSRCCTTVCDTDGQTHTNARASCIHYVNTAAFIYINAHPLNIATHTQKCVCQFIGQVLKSLSCLFYHNYSLKVHLHCTVQTD